MPNDVGVFEPWHREYFALIRITGVAELQCSSSRDSRCHRTATDRITKESYSPMVYIRSGIFEKKNKHDFLTDLSIQRTSWLQRKDCGDERVAEGVDGHLSDQ